MHITSILYQIQQSVTSLLVKYNILKMNILKINILNVKIQQNCIVTKVNHINYKSKQ